MDGEALAHRGFVDSRNLGLNLAYVRHRQPGVASEQGFQDPDPAHHRRGAGAIGGDAMNGGLGDQAPPGKVRPHVHATDGVTLHSLDAIKAGQAFVDGDEIGRDLDGVEGEPVQVAQR